MKLSKSELVKVFEQDLEAFLSSEYFKGIYPDISVRNCKVSLIKSRLDMVKDAISVLEFDTKKFFEIFKFVFDREDKDIADKEFFDNAYDYGRYLNFPNSQNLELTKETRNNIRLFYGILRIVSKLEKLSKKNSFIAIHPLELMSEKEAEFSKEYSRFRYAFESNFVYELMKLNQNTGGFNTLDHISGVYDVAMYTARELKKAGVPIDLVVVSGAAAGHDIGKYGCKESESDRVPYLHYYYTDLWFKNHDIPFIGNVAVNHSTWDLELETLPIESLVLIYADFRVKNRFYNGKREMYIFTLEDSFQVILDMLDNVDEAKEKRYRKVYAKLLDFEMYMGNLGVKIFGEEGKYTKYFLTSKPVELIDENEVVDFIKQASINNNVRLMGRLSKEQSFSKIIDMAGGAGDWRVLRGYLDIFEGYYVYLTQGQKVTTCKFLYELLYHREEDVRNQAATIIGKIIASYEEEYRKEVPIDSNVEPDEGGDQLFANYLESFFHPDHKMIDAHRERVGLNAKNMIDAVFKNSNERKNRDFYCIFSEYMINSMDKGEQGIIYLIQAIKHINFNALVSVSLDDLIEFLCFALNSKNIDIVTSSIKTAYIVLQKLPKSSKYREKLLEVFVGCKNMTDIPIISFLKFRSGMRLGLEDKVIKELAKAYEGSNIPIMEIYLMNLKNATSWIIKKANIDILLEEALSNVKTSNLQTAMHLCNLLKVSAIESVRNHAGRALVKMFETLGEHERNEVCIELNGALSMQDYQFTKYIPEYLAKLISMLKKDEYNEHLIDLYEKIKTGSTRTAFLALRCVGHLIGGFEGYVKRYDISGEEEDELLKFMLGALLNGLYNYNPHIQQEAFGVIGKQVFASSEITMEMKLKVFKLTKKKIANAIKNNCNDDISFFGSTGALNNIYRFISEYEHQYGEFIFEEKKPVAFFPGTFDPFSLSHKEIAREIRNLGFDVYLAIDEFSWSKKTQPNGLRRDIASMSVSDEMSIYMYPENIQVNIANEIDIKRLKDSFGKRSVYIVVGSDVVINASSYKKEPKEHTIHSLDHIVFERISKNVGEEKTLGKALEQIKGQVVRLSLPTKYEDISSTQIRDYIDENRDVTQLVDPLAQKYIYEYGLYRREPQYKSVLTAHFLSSKTYETMEKEDMLKIVNEVLGENKETVEAFENLYDTHKQDLRVVTLVDKKNGETVAFASFHVLRSSGYFNEFKDEILCDYVRNNGIGRIALINGMYIKASSRFDNMEQIIITETLSFCLEKDYTYGVFNKLIQNYNSCKLENILELQGFISVAGKCKERALYVANMTNPCIINLDMAMIMKEPIKSNYEVRKALITTRMKLQKALTALYPGQLILSFDMDMMNEKIIKKVCETNCVSDESTKVLGESMCVPFGSILNSTVIPNTVTKSLHTEKVYSHDVSRFDIDAYPSYMSIENQVKMLNSFNRPIILLDDLLHKGYRINALDPVLKRYGINVEKLVFGVMSGRGKELMDIQNREVDSAYFIPNIRAWFNEKGMYPFVGGDSVDRDLSKKRYMLPSIYFTLPYASPTFVRDTKAEAVYELSKVCLENSIELFETIETEYQKEHERNFTLKQLGEIFTKSRCPDLGENIEYDLNLKPSDYLKNDLERLKRIKVSLTEEGK